MRTPIAFFWAVSLVFVSGCTSTNTAPTTTTQPKSADVEEPLDRASVREARMLADAHRYREAIEIYDALLKTHPENTFVLARLASALSSQADQESDGEKAKALNKRARALAEQAEKLGTDDPMPPILLATIKPDGIKATLPKGHFSNREQVDQLMREGEEAFGRHDFAKAGESHAKAYELEPTNYRAALLAGDAHFSARNMVVAAEWFRKAIAIDPDIETAHRYLGDALEKLGRSQEAFDEKLAALICDPYQRTTRQHFPAQLQARAEARGRTIPRFPAMRSKIEGKQIILSVNEDDGILIMGYNLVAVGWREAEFAKNYPNEQTPRRSLREEIAAINAMLQLTENPKDEDKVALKKWEKVTEGLKTLKREGLLEAFVLLDRVDKDLAKDYVGYRAEHRSELERYVRLYWCGFDDK
ncbi:MAG: tetratricopeptide repeat protein [Nibricoccus sp.]